jgi:TonB-linked SusC/RagA family outer membrane protein
MKKKLLILIWFFVIQLNASAQESKIIVSGKVTETSTDIPIPSANILEKGTTNGVLTDFDGLFTITVKPDAVLVISYVGYTTSEIEVNNLTDIDITLEPSTSTLDEVVLVGYGTMKKSDVTGAVASVNAEKLNTLPTANAVESLQGKIAGVNIGAVTAPGETPSIRIRGNRSLNASNEPLYVVDGIPRNTIADIPVTDIQSIEVLKDAASTAIYGSRGANGVILVTTKRGGVNQPTQIAFNSYTGINEPKYPKMMNGNQYVKFRRDVFRANQDSGWNSGEPNNELVFAPSELETVNNNNFVDWQDLLFRDISLTQEYNLRVSQGSEKTQFSLSLGYRNEEGYYETSGMERLTMGINLDHKISKIIKVGLTSKISSTTINNFTLPGTNLQYMNPVSQPYDNEGNLINNPSVQQTAAWNILANYDEPYIDRDNYVRNFNVLYAEVNLLQGLKLRSNLGLNLEQVDGRQYYGSLTTPRYGRADFAAKSNEKNINLTWDNILNYVKDFGKHSVNATFVTSYQEQTNKSSLSSGEGFPGEILEDWNLGSATQNVQIASAYEKWTLASLLGRFQYGYEDRYLLNFSMRADGSSVLAPGNKWGYFPAASAAWVVHKEKFFNSEAINSLKLRLSYGVVGNSSIDPYGTIAGTNQTTYNFGNQYYYGYQLAGLVNKELGWEYSKTFNVGLDLGFLNNRISGSLEFYRTKTTDLLMQRNIPEFTGSSSVYQNVGSTSNTGFEAMLTSTNINSSNFSWSTDFNFYTNKEKILSLLSDEDMVGNEWFIGQPTGVFYDYEKIGIWQLDEAEEAQQYNQEPGDIRLKDQNPDDGDFSIDADNDRVILGQRDPKFGLFLRNNFEYKNFNFAFALEGKFGQKVYSDIYGQIFLDGTRWLPSAVAGEIWTPDNPSGSYPYLNRAVEPRINLYGIKDGSYLNVQEISIGYNLKSLNVFNNFQIYARVKNPFYIYTGDNDIDPQAPGFDLSAYRTYVLGLNINL